MRISACSNWIGIHKHNAEVIQFDDLRGINGGGGIPKTVPVDEHMERKPFTWLRMPTTKPYHRFIPAKTSAEKDPFRCSGCTTHGVIGIIATALQLMSTGPSWGPSTHVTRPILRPFNSCQPAHPQALQLMSTGPSSGPSTHVNRPILRPFNSCHAAHPQALQLMSTGPSSGPSTHVNRPILRPFNLCHAAHPQALQLMSTGPSSGPSTHVNRPILRPFNSCHTPHPQALQLMSTGPSSGPSTHVNRPILRPFNSCHAAHPQALQLMSHGPSSCQIIPFVVRTEPFGTCKDMQKTRRRGRWGGAAFVRDWLSSHWGSIGSRTKRERNLNYNQDEKYRFFVEVSVFVEGVM